MKLNVFDILNFFIFFVGLLAIIRWNAVAKIFHPFLYFIWVGCINDALSYVLVATGRHTLINNNIYILAEALLLLWFFQKAGFFKEPTKLLPVAAAVIATTWLLEILFIDKMSRIVVITSIVYSFSVVLMSISTINSLVLNHRGPVLKNALFLICAAFISYYTLNVLVNAFWLYGLNKSRHFLMNIYHIMLAVNFITNVIYAAAILLMPRRQPFPASAD